MAVKPATSEALAGAARQLGYALQQSPSLDEAFKKLYAVADEPHRRTLQELERLLRSPPEGSDGESVASTPYPTLKWVLSQVSDPDRAAAPVFQEFRRQESFSAANIVVIWSEFAGFLTYLGAVLGILIVVAGMYAIFMLPQFSFLYRGFGNELPGLTKFAFGGGTHIFFILLLLTVLALAYVGWFVHRLRRQLRRYMPMPAGFRRIPLLGPVTRAYDDYLWLACAGLLRSAGVPADQALRAARDRLGLTPSDSTLAHASDRGLVSDLAVAERLGRLGEELQFQQEAAIDRFLVALARCRRTTRIVLTASTYFLVGMFVSAMYLPLFSLGSNL